MPGWTAGALLNIRVTKGDPGHLKIIFAWDGKERGLEGFYSLSVASHILSLHTMLSITDVTTANFSQLQNKDKLDWRTFCPSSPFILRESTKGKGLSSRHGFIVWCLLELCIQSRHLKLGWLLQS